MADRKSGPVKPPVIDLKARDAAESPAPDTAPEAADSPARKPPAARRGRASRPAEGAPPETPDVEFASAAESVDIADETLAEAAGRAEAATAADETAAEQPAVSASPSALPPPPRPPARLAMPWSAISVAALAGAVLGAGLTYLTANWIALPQQEPPFADPAPLLDEFAARAAAIEERLLAVEDTARTTRVSLDATLTQFDTTAAALREELAALEAAIPEPQAAVDLSPIETELQTLESRVAAIAAGASSDDAAALATSLSGIEATLATMAGRLDEFETRAGEGDARLTTLAADLEEARAAIAAQAATLGGAEIGPAVKLPLIVSGLEAAFTGGRPFTDELASLTTLLPDLNVPPVIAAAAESGLARPDALAARFDRVLPDIIAGRTQESSGDIAQDAIEWAKALLALRPAEEIEGDTPEAVVSRLEAAVGRRDFVAAATELAQLPPPMQEAAGEVGADIAAHAEAAAFINRLRAQALAPATEPAS